MEKMHIDALCVPGHKGLMGPQGVGMLLLGSGVSPRPLLEGGNGVDSLSRDMKGEPPEVYEAGTLPGVAIAGLLGGISFVKGLGISAIREHEADLGERLKQGLWELPQITLYAPHRVGGILLFSVKGMTSEQVCTALDRGGIMTRGGFHCSALGHQTLGTPPEGAVRVSFGYHNTPKDCDRIIEALSRLKV